MHPPPPCFLYWTVHLPLLSVTTLYKEIVRQVRAAPAHKSDCQGATNGMSQVSLVYSKTAKYSNLSLFFSEKAINMVTANSP